MSVFASISVGRSTFEARVAVAEPEAVKHAEADPSGLPELLIVGAGGQAFTWELRCFGGKLLERGIEAFSTRELARADGEAVLASLSGS